LGRIVGVNQVFAEMLPADKVEKVSTRVDALS